LSALKYVSDSDTDAYNSDGGVTDKDEEEDDVEEEDHIHGRRRSSSDDRGVSCGESESSPSSSNGGERKTKKRGGPHLTGLYSQGEETKDDDNDKEVSGKRVKADGVVCRDDVRKNNTGISVESKLVRWLVLL